jgi:hypothetical protein
MVCGAWLTRRSLALAVTASMYGVAADAQAGYEVSKSQTVQKAPAGFVGRTTTDRETRVGNTPETDGNSSTFVLTIGGFVRKCPTADGIAAGSFEYSVTSDQVDTDRGETKRTHYVHRMLARLEGHVRDDAKIDHVDVDADFTRERTGVPPEQQHIRASFRPGEGGAPDMQSVLRAVEMTANVSVATLMWSAGPIYLDAMLEWNKMNQCVEFSFDPPSETQALGPNATAEVRTELRTKEGKSAVAGGKMEANSLQGIGTIAPHKGETKADAPFVFSYTAPAKPKRGNGFDVATFSRAGAAGGKWTIGAPELLLTFDLTLTQRAEGIASEFHVVLPETRLLAEQDGVYRGTGPVTSKGGFRGDECSMDVNFTSTIRIAARPEDPERTRFRLEFIPNEPQHPAVMKCPEFSRTVPLPFATWIHGPTVNPAVLGQAVPVKAELNVNGLTATMTGPVRISLPPRE